MLKQMRSGAQSTVVKLVLFGLLLLAMTGLALMDGQGTLRGALKSNTVASIGREKISLPAFDNMVQNAIRQQRMKQSEAYKSGVPHRVLKEYIDRSIFRKAVQDEGLLIGDAEAAKQIKEMLAPYVEKGMSQRDALNGLLRANGMREADLVSGVKEEIAVRLLLRLVAGGATAPAQLAQDLLKFRNESRRGEFFRLTAANAGAVPQPPESVLKSYYNTLAADYTIPEYRTLSVLVLDKNALGDNIKISDDKLREYYDDNIAAYKTGETRVIAQVVASDEAAAQDIYAAAQKSKNLQAAAKGPDGKSRGSYVGPQSFTEDKIAVELAKTAFSGKASDILPPVQSPLGWHILHIEKVTPGTEQSFESVKASIAKELAQEQASEALYTFANKIDDEIAGGKSVAEVAQGNHLPLTTIEKIDVHGLGRDGTKPVLTLPLYDKLVESGFGLAKGAASPLIETPDGAYMIVGVAEIFPAEQRSYDKIHTELVNRWMTEKRLQLLGEKAAQITDRLRKGEDFRAIAAEVGQSVQSTPLLQRGTPAVKAGVDSLMLSTLFALDSIGQARSVPDNNTVTVIRFAERKIQPAADKDAQEMHSVLSRAVGTDLLAQYRMGLVNTYDVQINAKLLASQYSEKAASADGEE